MEIKEGNKLIAEFFGLKNGWWISQQKPLTDDKKQWCDLGGTTFLGSRVYFDKDLLFHSSWDWLMPVVEKIAKEYDVKITWMPNALDCTYIERPDTEDGEISSMGGMTAIQNTWHTVVKFIEWYNTKSPNRIKTKRK